MHYLLFQNHHKIQYSIYRHDSPALLPTVTVVTSWVCVSPVCVHCMSDYEKFSSPIWKAMEDDQFICISGVHGDRRHSV